MRIGSDYFEVHHLSDGTEVRLRLLRASDRGKIAAGFRRLSPESRYRRFFSPMPRLSERMLRQLTQTDDWLLHSLDEHATARIEDGLRVYELDLPEPSLEALFAAPIYRLFKLVAEGVQAVFGSSRFRSARRDVGPSPAARVPLLPDRDR